MYSKADTHMHTTLSDGLMSPEEMVDYIAVHTNLSVIAITDHNTAEGSLIAHDYARRKGLKLEVIIGQEMSTGDGDVVGLFLTSTLPRFETAREAIHAIHAQGGLAIAVHPFSRWSTFNLMNGLGSKIFDLPLDGVEIRNGFPTNIFSNPTTAWFNRLLGQNLPELGGSDSHSPFTVGQSFTWFPGRTAADFRRAIEQGTVRAGGTLWAPLSQLRFWTMLFKRRGLRQPEPIYSD
jgi:hypothetical protein